MCMKGEVAPGKEMDRVKILEWHLHAPQRAFLAEEALSNKVGRMTHLVNVSQPLSVVPVVPVQQVWVTSVLALCRDGGYA